MKVLLAKGFSQYGGTRLFVDYAAAAFREKGFDTYTVDLTTVEPNIIGILENIEKHCPFDLIFSINYFAELGHGDRSDGSWRYISEILNAPHVVWFTDYLLSFQDILEKTSKNTAILSVDPTQINCIKSIFGNDRFKCMAFFPHPAIGGDAIVDEDINQFIERRTIPILWSGTFHKPKMRPWSQAPIQTRKLFDDAVDICLSEEWVPPHEAIDQVLRSRGLDLSNPVIQGVRKAAWLVDAEVRVSRRFEFVKKLAKSGLPLHICGVGWEAELYRFKNVSYLGEVSMEKSVDLMKHSRIVLNTNGNFGGGSHERPFSALLSGAACFTDYSTYYGKVFEDNKNIKMYKWKSLDDGMEKLDEMHRDNQISFEVARYGREEVLLNHTWSKRIDSIIEIGAGLTRN